MADRGKKTIINTVMSLLQEVVAVICAFILPRLILTAFGSDYNGITTSITQFLSAAVLLRAGIGGATRAALYIPLAANDKNRINSIMRATDLFMKKIGLILGASIFVFAAIYPIFVKEFDWFFTFSLFLIIGLSTFAESFFGITYLILLQSDQQLWIPHLIQTICYILNTAFAALLIKMNCSIHMVKLVSSVVFAIYPLILNFYVKRRYKLNLKVQPDNTAISQRWDAFWHQIAVFVMTNTPVIILTCFSNMLEVSVYSVYNLVINGLKRAVFAFSGGLEAAFGNMIARKEQRALRENVSVIEFVFHSISTVVYTTAILMVLQFVNIYTSGITDADYHRPLFAYILLIAQFFNGIRLPYQMVVQAAGHYKQTKSGAIVEPAINIVLSVVLVIKFGIVGVAIGTLSATIFRTIQFSVYMCKNLVKRSQFIALFKCLISFAQGALIIFVVNMLNLNSPATYLQWAGNAVIVFVVSVGIVAISSGLIFKNDLKNTIKKIKNSFYRA